MERTYRLLLGLAVLLLLTGCSLLQVRGESKRHYAFTVITGQIAVPVGSQGGISVAAIASDDQHPREVHRIWLHEPGGYELIVPPGDYTVQATAAAGDGIGAQPSLAGTSLPIAVRDSGVITQVDLILEPVSQVLARESGSTAARHSTQAGAITEFGSPLISAVSGSQGYWAPVETFQRIGGNVHFLAPYDSERIPVLFVHGALGAGEDWRHLASALGEQYQPWIFQYPSGASLEAISHLLYWKLLNLRARYGFKRLHVVAHSMGGLVVRRFLIDHGIQFPEISIFVSLSTPWDGDSRAAAGVAHSPVVVPSWRDMQPNGQFLKDLFARPIPTHTKHTLVFGYKGASLVDLTGDDGVVTLASQLRQEAQSAATQVVGHNEDHASILTSPTVRETIQIAFRDAEEALEGRDQRVLLRVRLRGIDASTAALPLWVLAWAVDGGFTRPQLLPLQHDAEDFHVELPPGKYVLQPLVAGYRSNLVDVNIAGDGERVAFAMVPQGLLVGRLYWHNDLAMPSGARAPESAAPKGVRIELEGEGVRRSLVLDGDTEQTLALQAWARGDDAATQGWFGFADLPAGTYRIAAHLPGHAPRYSIHHVVPGRSAPVMSLGIPRRELSSHATR